MERTTRLYVPQRDPRTEYAQAVAENADRWIAACGGHEVPFTHNGATWLYVWNPRTNEHGYLNVETDIVQEEIFSF